MLIILFNLSILFAQNSDNPTTDKKQSIEKTESLQKAKPETKKMVLKDAEIEWGDVKGALRYRVQIKNFNEDLIIDKEVTDNSIKVSLYKGDFYLRIAVVNKFEKISVWSDWAKISVVIKDKVIHNYNKTLLGLGLRVGIGGHYYQVLPDWNNLYENSLKGVDFNLAYGFKYIKSLRTTFLRFTGVQLDFNYIDFDGLQDFTKVDTGMSNVFIGLDIFGCTNFNFPINFIFRAGGGLVNSTLNIQKHDESGNALEYEEIATQDPFYKFGASVECTYYPGFFIDIGADYTTISYIEKSFTSLRYFAVVGVKL